MGYNFGQFPKLLNYCFLAKPIIFLNTSYLRHYGSPLNIENETEWQNIMAALLSKFPGFIFKPNRLVKMTKLFFRI